jgi:hypothetical protein
MNIQKCVILAVALGLMAGSAALLHELRASQRLGAPGIKTAAIPNSPRREILLPELALDFTSRAIPTDQSVLDYMPPDSSFATRLYTASDGFQAAVNVVLMGTDRSSIHKPQFCLTGQGWTIDDTRSVYTNISMSRPRPYELEVHELRCSRDDPVKPHGVYVYWFVADNEMTARHGSRMWNMAWELLKTGVLQRWAYITYFARCEPGQDDATYARMEKLIQATVPQFQTVPGPRDAGTAVIQTASK